MSGLYLPGMEMPKDCGSCKLVKPFAIDSELILFCPINGEAYCKERKGCPLVPVPDHGDLIDKSCVDVLSWTDGEYGTTFDDGVLFVLDKLDELPVIIPANGEDYEAPASKEGE